MAAKSNYQSVAEKIIAESVRSAIFIDDKARSFFSPESSPVLLEEELTVALHEGFKKSNVSLSVYKFQKGNEIDPDLKKYLFESRDLVLLDWKLDDQNGEEYSLQLLSDVVQSAHIHFCVVYTSMPNVEAIFNNIVSYFSSKNKEYYEKVKLDLAADEEILVPILEKFNLHDAAASKIALQEIARNTELKNELLRITGEKNINQSLKMASIAFSNYHKANNTLPTPEAVDIPNRICVINSTIIAVLNKKQETDPEELLNRIATQITKSPSSFTQLLGFEMQSLFSKQSSFIDSNLLKVSPEALLAHRKQVVEKEGNDNSFKQFIKSLLIEHASSGLRTARLHLLEQEFLDKQSAEINTLPTDDALFSMNVFYNSRKITSLYEGHDPMLNFGDVFVDNNGNYFMCITALCDCYRPAKIQNNYYFAHGQRISKNLALKLGDTGFVSFLPNQEVVTWVFPESDDEIKNESNTEVLAEYFKQYKYKPIYIKPIIFNVRYEYIKEGEIEIRNLEVVEKKEDIVFNTIKYVATIRDSYTQRIANHAFSHPVRVGVDFVKK